MVSGLILWTRFELPAPRMWHGFAGISPSCWAVVAIRAVPRHRQRRIHPRHAGLKKRPSNTLITHQRTPSSIHLAPTLTKETDTAPTPAPLTTAAKSVTPT